MVINMPMKEDLWEEPGEEDENIDFTSSGGIEYYGGHYYIDDVHISLKSYPEFLDSKSKCQSCIFFDPSDCRLRDVSLREELKTLLDIERENHEARLRRQRILIRAIRQELQAHGRPLHYQVLARIVIERHPKLALTEGSVLRIMMHHPEEFECVGTGVYRCK